MRLDWYLEKNAIPVEVFADKIGVHRTSIYRFMKGLTFPRRETLRRIKEVTGGRVTAEDFVDVSASKRPLSAAS
jgi:hypothetical protein